MLIIHFDSFKDKTFFADILINETKKNSWTICEGEIIRDQFPCLFFFCEQDKPIGHILEALYTFSYDSNILKKPMWCNGKQIAIQKGVFVVKYTNP